MDEDLYFEMLISALHMFPQIVCCHAGTFHCNKYTIKQLSSSLIVFTDRIIHHHNETSRENIHRLRKVRIYRLDLMERPLLLWTIQLNQSPFQTQR